MYEIMKNTDFTQEEIEQKKQAQKILELFKGKTLKELHSVLRLAKELAEQEAILS